MVAGKVLTLRAIRNQAFRDVVYEWEEDLCEFSDFTLEEVKENEFLRNSHRLLGEKLNNQLLKIIRRKKFAEIDQDKPINLAIVTTVNDAVLLKEPNTIPVFLDAWESHIDFVMNVTSRLPIFFVTTVDLYEYIKRSNPDSAVVYLPLCISTRWKMKDIPVKEWDVVQVGRKNQMLHECMLQYVKEKPDVEYVYSDKNGTRGDLVYFSSKKGCIGQMVTRTDYMDLLRKSKVCLVSSPRADSTSDTRFIDFPTPRFYESAASYCQLLGIHSGHIEFEQQGVNRVMTGVQNYHEFKSALDVLLDKDIDRDAYDHFVDKNDSIHWSNSLISQLDAVL